MHPLLNQFDIGAGGVDVGDVVLLEGGVDRPRHTVRPDDDRNRRVGLCLQREQLLELFDRDGPQRAQLLDYLGIVDNFAEGIQLWKAGELAVLQLLLDGIDRPLHPKAEAGGFGDGDWHGSSSFRDGFFKGSGF